MVTATGNSYPSYISVASIKRYWLDTIAPSYFNFENTNNYSVGIFGYVNEVMGNTTEDVFNAVAITRREFYPVTAQFISSLYTMATLQNIEIPLTKPSTCRCILIIPQSEIISNSVKLNEGGQFECVIDDCLKIFAGDLQFMLDYPIRIISKQNEGSLEWAHTVHYDISTKNSLASAITNANSSRYISMKILKENGINYVALFIDTIRQLEMVEKNEIVVKDTILDTVTMDVDFDGNLANFEIFYKENANSEEIQLEKYMLNAAITSPNPYVQYELVNPNKIRLTFAYNGVWNPKINSEVIIHIYTSEGSNGNFNQFTEDIVCSSNSEKYPYNANMTIVGRISGSATGGSDQLITQEFRNKVVMAYATNKTITTENDLQLYFNDLSDDIKGVKILFHKRRDDIFIRLFGAYSVYRDENNDIIPTNTLELRFEKSDLTPESESSLMQIPTGSVFEYDNIRIAQPGTSYYANTTFSTPAGVLDTIAQVTPVGTTSYGTTIISGTTYYIKLADCEVSRSTVIPIKDNNGLVNIMDAMRQYRGSQYANNLYFTNPFMMIIHSNPNSCGYYLNSVEETLPIEYTYINDNSFQQFIASTLEVYRNAMAGNDFYRFRMRVTPTSDSSVDFYEENTQPATQRQFRAGSSGMILGEEYHFDDINGYGYIRTRFKYDNSEQEQYIISSNSIKLSIPSTQEGGQIVTYNGYKMNFKVGERFNKNDIIAEKRVIDLANLILVGIIDGQDHIGGIGAGNLYIPMSIQDIDPDSGAMIMEGFVATNDKVGANNTLELTHGVLQASGEEYNDSLSVVMTKETFLVDVLYRDPAVNVSEKYSGYNHLEDMTHTNTYMSSSDAPYDLITPLVFIRSTVGFYPINPLAPYDNDDYHAYIDGVPLLGARWAVDTTQFDYFIQQYFKMNESLGDAYLALNNTYSIDSKFYNTYGRARFYTVGNNLDSMEPLDNVRCNFHFGVKLTTISNVDDFINKFRNFVREYIESGDSVITESQDIYIMSLISALKEEFEEIQYLEYYGFNEYNYSAQKIVGPDLDEFQEDFVPEYINLEILKDAAGKSYPAVVVDIL